jgi:hypothetical protein
MRKRKLLPIERFFGIGTIGYGEPDPVPKELMAAAMLFFLTALMAF